MTTHELGNRSNWPVSNRVSLIPNVGGVFLDTTAAIGIEDVMRGEFPRISLLVVTYPDIRVLQERQLSTPPSNEPEPTGYYNFLRLRVNQNEERRTTYIGNQYKISYAGLGNNQATLNIYSPDPVRITEIPQVRDELRDTLIYTFNLVRRSRRHTT